MKKYLFMLLTLVIVCIFPIDTKANSGVEILRSSEKDLTTLVKVTNWSSELVDIKCDIGNRKAEFMAIPTGEHYVFLRGYIPYYSEIRKVTRIRSICDEPYTCSWGKYVYGSKCTYILSKTYLNGSGVVYFDNNGDIVDYSASVQDDVKCKIETKYMPGYRALVCMYLANLY